MKELYSILLLISLVIYSEAQSDTAKSAIKDSLFTVNISDSTLILKSDSLTILAKDSLAEIIPLKNAKTLLGAASFYSRKFEGTKTATGDIFHHANLTAASNNFKLNTWVRVTNLKNGESVIVLINDRMHPTMAKKGRVVDLTSSAAKKIGLTSKIGVVKVKVEQVAKGTIE